MEIIIGRDQQEQKLSIIRDGNQVCYGQPKSVPMSVSRKHLSLESLEEGKWRIKNLNERNVTYVNGIAIESKIVTESDKIELGEARYHFSWDAIQEPKEDLADIRPLKAIWDDFNDQRLRLQITERKFNAARSATGIITMLAIACSIILGHGPIYLILYGLAIGISVVFTYVAYKKSSEVPIRQQEINKEFQKKYVCPKCGHFMSFQDYDVLIQNDVCPFCKTKYKK